MQQSSKSILHVIKSYHPTVGGMETVARQLAEGAARYGHEVSVLCCGGNCNEEREINGVTVHRIKPFFNVGSAPLSLCYILKLWQLMERSDIVHFHVPNPIGELAFCLARWTKKRVKTVCTYHLDPVRPKTFVRLYKILLHQFLSQCNVICPTSPQYVLSSDILQKHSNKCRPVPLGVEVSRFGHVDPVALSEAERLVCHLKSPRVLFCGRFSYYKGLHVLVEAMSRLPSASLVLVGQGEKEEELKRQVKDLNLQERVAFLGHLPDDLYAAVYHTADIFVLPSIYRSEAFGIVGLEAMAAGLPLITTELGTGTSFYNVDGETGYVVPPMDPDALVEALQKMLSNPEKLCEMKKNAFERVKDFCVHSMIEKNFAIYSELHSEKI